MLEAAWDGAFNMLHVCGTALNFAGFSDYPVHAINWADRYAGFSIASISGWMQPATCGGLNNPGTMAEGSPEDCEKEVADALRQAGDRPMILAPGCTFDPDTVPAENLTAIRKSVENWPGLQASVF
jgi:uroporphyrinogen decarboxylase